MKDLDRTLAQASLVCNIEGMHCASCAARIERLVGALPGIASVSVNLATRQGHIAYDPERVSADDIIKRIHEIGYLASIAKPQDEATRHGAAEEAAWKHQALKLAGGFALALPVAAFSMLPLHWPWRDWFNLLATTSVLLLVGQRFFTAAWRALRAGTADMNVLVSLGVGTAYLYSLATLALPSLWQKWGITPHTYFEAAAVICVFVALGRLLEERARVRTGDAVRSLLSRTPQTVVRLRDGTQENIPLADVQVGDLLLIRPGDFVPVDGIVTDGSSWVDESLLTGESLPVAKNKGDDVFSGTMNTTGALVVRATHVGAETVLRRIVELVQEAQTTKPPMARLADRVSSVFVPTVVVVALLAAAGWLVFGGLERMGHAVQAFVSVLIIACPCALGLATPTAVIVAAGQAAQRGILFRKAAALENAARLDVILLDKTGTLTVGRPEVVAVESCDPMRWPPAEILRAAAWAEQFSEHPLGRTIVGAVPSIESPPPAQFQAVAGKGIVAESGARRVLVGTIELLESLGIGTDQAQPIMERLARTGITPLAVGVNATCIGVVGLADRPKPEAPKVVQELVQKGFEVWVVTGDRAEVAQAIAKSVGIGKIIAGVNPMGKAETVRELQRSGRRVGFVGDGVNDAPALAQADVGFALGAGADVAIQAGDVTLLGKSLSTICHAMEIARLAVRTIRQNLFFAFVYNVACIPLAAGVFYPPWGFLLDPMIASAAMAASSVCVVTNSLWLARRLRRRLSAGC